MVCSFLLSFFCSAFSHSASFPILSQKPLCVKRRNSPYTYEYRGIPEQSFSRLPAEYPGKTICSHICRLIHLSLAPFFKTAYNCMKEYIPAAAFFLIRVPITAMYRWAGFERKKHAFSDRLHKKTEKKYLCSRHAERLVPAGSVRYRLSYPAEEKFFFRLPSFRLTERTHTSRGPSGSRGYRDEALSHL